MRITFFIDNDNVVSIPRFIVYFTNNIRMENNQYYIDKLKKPSI